MSLMNKVAALVISITSMSVNAESTAWPPLPKQGFIAGRPASQADVASGNAVFVAAVGGVSIGKPLAIAIPQYAYYNDKGSKVAVVVVQAEEAQGKKLIGARKPNGQEVAGFITDFELLGNVLPLPVAP